MSKGGRQKFTGNPSYWGTGYKPTYIPKSEVRDFNLDKSLAAPLGARTLRELGDEGMQYNSMGAFLLGVVKDNDEEFIACPFDSMHSSFSRHYRMTIGMSKVAEIERLDNPEQERNNLIAAAFNAKLIKLTDEQQDKAEELGILKSKY